MFAAHKDILKELYPVNLTINTLGYGLDAYKGYLCIKKGIKCVIDDKIKVFHPLGTGYNTNTASMQFLNWMEQPDMNEFKKFWFDYSEKNKSDSEKTLKEWKQK